MYTTAVIDKRMVLVVMTIRTFCSICQTVTPKRTYKEYNGYEFTVCLECHTNLTPRS